MRFRQPVLFCEVLERAAKLFATEQPEKIDQLNTANRNLDKLMQQSPHILNLYVTLVYAEMTQPY
jgi:phosphorylase kinase alpha/beta subunit